MENPEIGLILCNLINRSKQKRHFISVFFLQKKGELYMNKVILVGRLTRDPELRVTAGERNCSVARFGIAVPKNKNREEADFFNVECWEGLAEFANNYLRKGSKIVLSGKLSDNSYNDKDGNRRQNVVIVVNEIEFAESKSVN